MMKFFRKIRQKLLTENKFSKYLIYAIGEIVLVVIGILIALQINNGNENRKISKNSKAIAVTIISELKNVREKLNRSLVRNEKIVKRMSSYLDDDFPESEKNNATVLHLIAHQNIKLNIPLVISVLENNDSRTLSDKKLLKNLRDLNSLKEGLGINEAFLDDFWNSKSVEFLIRKKYAYSLFDKVARKKISNEISFRELYNDEEYKNLIAIKWGLHNTSVSSQRATLKKVDEILNYLKSNSN